MAIDLILMKIKFGNFKYKLIFSYVFIILVSFSFIAFFLDKTLEKNSLQELKSSLINQAYLIETQISIEDLKNENLIYLEALAKKLSSKIKSRITIVNNKGKVLADSSEPLSEVLNMENHAYRSEIKLALGGGIGEQIRYSSTLKKDMLYLALPIKDNEQIIGVVRLALPLTNVQIIFAAIRKTVFLSLIFALGLAFVLGAVLTAGIIGPISRIIHISRKFFKGDFSHKILLDSQDEIGELAATLNKMAEGLENKIKEIEIQNQHLKAILESMVEGIIVTDRVGHIISINHAVEQIFNITKQDSQGKLLLEVIRNNDISDIPAEVLRSGKFLSRELLLVWPVNKTFQIDASPVFEKGSVSGCLLVIHDVTQIRILETIRRDFVANVSHELKTPLTSIKGFVETLLEGALDDKENSRHFLQIINDHADRLSNLINDLLDLSHLESGELRLEKTEVNLRDLAQDILSSFKSQLNKKSVTAKNDLPKDLLVRIDKDKMGQVLANLVDNAIKFNHENGSLKIYSQDANNEIKIIIEDSGIGIPERDMPRIFERFYRVDKARSRELGGTGLGLSIVRHIIELHGGSVGVRSTEGLGSKFWFTIPS